MHLVRERGGLGLHLEHGTTENKQDPLSVYISHIEPDSAAQR